jgi:hypothetical protein
MKKIVAISLVLALLCGAFAFAQDDAAKGKGITISGWGRGVFTAVKAAIPDKGDTVVTTGLGPWGLAPNVGITVKGETETVGFKFGIDNGNSNTISLGDAFIWVKPLDVVKLEAGKFNNDTLRGKVGSPSDLVGYVGGSEGEDAIFTRLAAANGVVLSLTPIEGLFIGGLINTPHKDVTDEIEDVYEKIQIGAGYELPNLGHFRFQFIGAKDSITLTSEEEDVYEFDTATGEIKLKDKDSDFKPSIAADAKRVEAAFAYTGLEGLTLDVGFKIPFAVEQEGTTYQKAYQAAVGAKYSSGDLSLIGRVDATFGEKAEIKDLGDYSKGVGLKVNLNPGYDLGFAKVSGDISVNLVPEEKRGDTVTEKGEVKFGIGAWVEKALASGYIKTGVGLTLPGEVTKSTTIVVPVLLGYSF